jgi:hypothetical protein
MLAVIREKILGMIAELETVVQSLAWAKGLVEQDETLRITARRNLTKGGIAWDVSELPEEKCEAVLQMIEQIESRTRPALGLLYCAMVPTHRNPTNRWFDFKWLRKFSRRHHETILNHVADRYKGYTLLPASEGCWTKTPGRYQIEPVRPFLFTARTQQETNIIADLIALHYGQDEVMKFVWGYDVEFRTQWEMIPFYTNVLLPKRTR